MVRTEYQRKNQHDRRAAVRAAGLHGTYLVRNQFRAGREEERKFVRGARKLLRQDQNFKFPNFAVRYYRRTFGGRGI